MIVIFLKKQTNPLLSVSRSSNNDRRGLFVRLLEWFEEILGRKQNEKLHFYINESTVHYLKICECLHFIFHTYYWTCLVWLKHIVCVILVDVRVVYIYDDRVHGYHI